MLASAVILGLMAAAAFAVGRYGFGHADELLGFLSDPDMRDRRYRSVRNGSIATMAVGVMLGVAAVASLVIGLAES